jgi:ribosomal-protein-alanine N-acetyltransferase
LKNLLITTKRLTIRQLSAGDASFILEQYNEPAFLEHIGDKKIRSVDDAIENIISGAQASYRQHGVGLLLLELRDCGTPIGTCGLIKRENFEDLDLGYALLGKYHRQGYVIEAALAVLEHAKNIGLSRIVGYSSPFNQISIRVLEKLGFEDEGDFNFPGYDSASKIFAIKL